MKKRIFSLVLASTLMLGLVGCGSNNESQVSSDQKELEQAVEGLKADKDTYIISTTVNAPSESSQYIEVCGADFNYTEYPVDAEGNIVTDVDVNAVGNSYMLSDWMTEDSFYVWAMSNENEAGFYTLPDSYRTICEQRRYLYADYIMKDIKDVKKSDSIVADLGEGEQEYQIYKGTVSAEAITEIMKVGSYDLYEALETQYANDEAIKKYASFMKDETGFNLVFGDAKATFAVANGELRYYTLEIGGLGTRMYLTKSVVKSTTDVREKPDFTGAKEYAELIRETADYVSQYDTYDDALNSMLSDTAGNTSSSTDAEEVELSTEELITEEKTTEQESNDATVTDSE